MAVVRKSDATRVLPVLGMLVEVAVDGGEYQELRGASLVDHTSGSRSVNQVATLRGPGAVVGAKTVENVTFDLAAVNPSLKVMDDLARADLGQLNCRVRMSIYSRRIIRPAVNSGAGVSIAAPAGTTEAWGGKVTLPDNLVELFDTNEILMSDLIQLKDGGPPDADDETWIVNVVAVVEATNKITGEADAGVYVTKFDRSPATVEAAAGTNQFAARTAGWRQQFSGLVNQFGSIQGDASGSPSLSSGVVFTPHALLSQASILRLTEGGE